jgi:archaellum component FlaC
MKSLTGALQNRAIQQLMDGMRRVEAFIGAERAALGLAETNDRTSRVESHVVGLPAAMADVRRKVEEVLREVADLKAELSDCCPKVKKDLTNMEQELAKLKEDIRAMKPKTEPLAPPAANVAVPPDRITATPARKSSNSPLRPKVTSRPTKPAPVKVSPPLRQMTIQGLSLSLLARLSLKSHFQRNISLYP